MCLSIIGLAMLIGGIIALVKGEVAFTKTRKVTGAHARIIGVIMMLPLPLILLVGVAYGVMLAASGKTEIDASDPMMVVLEIVPVLGCGLLAVILGMVWSD